MKAFVCGRIAFDNIDLPSLSLKKVIGGSGTYGALAASLFAPTVMGGITGSDFPKSFFKEMSNHNIDLSLLQKSDKPAFRWTVRYSVDLSKLTVINREVGADVDFNIDKYKNRLQDVDVAFLGKIDPKQQLKLITLFPKQTIVITESMNRFMIDDRETFNKVLKHTDIFMVNMEEAGLLLDKKLPVPELMEQILQMGPKVAVFKKGEHGLTMYGKSGTMIIPSYPLVYAVDPTGAGDVLGGAIAGVLARLGGFTNANMRTAVLLASIMSSFTVEGYGIDAIKSVTLTEVINRTKMFLNQFPVITDLTAAHLGGE